MTGGGEMKPEETRRWLGRVTKWRTIFAGWQLGTRAMSNPEAAAVRDHREVTILLRAEMNALLGLLVSKGVITADEWTTAVGEEARQLDADFERRFPGMHSDDMGMRIDTAEARQTMRRMNFPA